MLFVFPYTSHSYTKYNALFLFGTDWTKVTYIQLQKMLSVTIQVFYCMLWQFSASLPTVYQTNLDCHKNPLIIPLRSYSVFSEGISNLHLVCFAQRISVQVLCCHDNRTVTFQGDRSIQSIPAVVNTLRLSGIR